MLRQLKKKKMDMDLCVFAYSAGLVFVLWRHICVAKCKQDRFKKSDSALISKTHEVCRCIFISITMRTLTRPNKYCKDIIKTLRRLSSPLSINHTQTPCVFILLCFPDTENFTHIINDNTLSGFVCVPERIILIRRQPGCESVISDSLSSFRMKVLTEK